MEIFTVNLNAEKHLKKTNKAILRVFHMVEQNFDLLQMTKESLTIELSKSKDTKMFHKE
jgi:hypothetical protein